MTCDIIRKTSYIIARAGEFLDSGEIFVSLLSITSLHHRTQP